MAYSGFLLKIGDWEFPESLMATNSYSPYVNMQDVDPWTDENGELHRNPIDLKALKVEFETKNMLTSTQFAEIMRNIRANYVSEKGRSCFITAYIPEYDDYVTQYAYLADFQPQIYSTGGGIVKYNSIRFAFIGGVAIDG
jgi:hypothetical protein